MKGKMLSFTGGLSPNSEAFAIFVTEKYLYENRRIFYLITRLKE